MPSVVHVVVTANFAGVERYVTTTSGALAALGWQVSVIGGHPERMRAALADDVSWRPGGSLGQAWESLRRLGSQDICHVHMTAAEAVALAGRHVHHAPVVATRHFAARRGSSLLGRFLGPVIARGLRAEIAISDHVAAALERPPTRVLRNGVPLRAEPAWRATSTTVLVMQRLELEKDTATALRAWHGSGLAGMGWNLRVVGEGAQRARLEEQVRREGIASVTFVGWTADVDRELGGAGLLLASAPDEPLGLSVIEAMGAGVPVVAADAGGHRESAGAVPGAAMFSPHDHEGAAAQLRRLALDDAARCRLAEAGRAVCRERFDLRRHAEELATFYDEVRGASRPTAVDLAPRSEVAR